MKRTATRATFHEARRHFLSGGTVLVADCDKGPTIKVTDLTTAHAGNVTDWRELVTEVRDWRNRYPRQRFYVVQPNGR